MSALILILISELEFHEGCGDVMPWHAKAFVGRNGKMARLSSLLSAGVGNSSKSNIHDRLSSVSLV